MPRAYAETHSNGLPIDRNVQSAIDGFLALGYEITTFTRDDIFADKFWRVADKNPFVGSIKSMTQHFLNLGCPPESIDYPAPLQAYLRRPVQRMPLANALASSEPLFIKPVATKLFDGSIYDGSKARRSYFADYIPCEVWASAVIPGIQAEWRCNIHRGQLVHASCYTGNFMKAPEWALLCEMSLQWEAGPVAYTLDVAVTDGDETTLVEVSDFWALASYGLDAVLYAEMLRDRYFEILGVSPQ